MITGVVLTVTLAVVFLTSALSGVLGMGGGMILMAFLAGLLPVTSAMVIHGVVQSVANGSRFLFLFRHVCWRVLPIFAAGIIAGLALFSFSIFSTETWVVYLLMGALPFIPKKLLKGAALDILRPGHSFICGLLVTLMQMLAGASGPLLDMFFQDTALTRLEIVATKAITQTVGHLIKATYYATLVSATQLVSADLFLLIAVATGGTWVGTRLLERMDEDKFRKWFKLGIRVIGVVCMLKGAQGFAGFANLT